MMIAATAALSALRGNWKLVAGIGVVIALVAALAVQTARIDGFGVWPFRMVGLKDKYETAVTKLAEERAARKADRATYINAQTAAKAKNEADVARKEAAHQENTNEIYSDHQRDLARVRAGGVRQDLAAVRSPARRAQAGSVPAPTCKPDDENLCVSRARVVQAAEIELGRNALIEWIVRQIAVER